MSKFLRAGEPMRNPTVEEISRLSAEINKGLDSLDAGRVVSADTLRQDIETLLATRRGAAPGMGR